MQQWRCLFASQFQVAHPAFPPAKPVALPAVYHRCKQHLLAQQRWISGLWVLFQFKLTSSSSGGNIGRGKRFLGGSHCQICCQGQTWKHTALNTHETQRPVFKMFPLSGWILYHKGKRKKTSAQHQQPHKNQEYPHKRKLPFLPNSAAADTVNTPVQKDNTDAAECHCLQNLQGQGYLTGINKKKIPSKGLPLQCSSCITAYKTENTAKEDLSSLFGKSQGTMHSQALGQQVNSSFYVSQGTDEARG